jgi:hypothetical protein
MEERNRQPGEKVTAWSARLKMIRLPPTATRAERARLAATRRHARLAVRRALASERLRQVFRLHPETCARAKAPGRSDALRRCFSEPEA